MASICQGAAYLFCEGRAVPVKNEALITLGSSKLLGIIPLQIVILIVLYLVFAFILNHTTFGRSLYVIGGNRMASRLAGLNPKKVSSVLYIQSGVISALAGCLLAGRMHSGVPTSVLGAEFGAITGRFWVAWLSRAAGGSRRLLYRPAHYPVLQQRPELCGCLLLLANGRKGTFADRGPARGFLPLPQSRRLNAPRTEICSLMSVNHERRNLK